MPPAHRSTSAGVSPVPGLYFLGLPWQHTRGSALLGFVGADAAHIADAHRDRTRDRARAGCLIVALIPVISPARPATRADQDSNLRFQVRRPVMSLHRSSIQDTAARPPVTATHHNDPASERATTPPTTSGPRPTPHTGGTPGGRCGRSSRSA